MGDVAALTWPLTRPGGPLPLHVNRVRRCLFGPVDQEKAKAHIKEELAKIQAEDAAKWNFDFSTGRPLPGGRFLWEPVGDQKDADKSNGGSASEVKSAKEKQTEITDFMRKRKSSSSLKEPVTLPPKIRRRSST